MLKGLRLSTKIILLGAGGVLVFAIVLTWISVMMERQVKREKILATKHVVEVAYSLLEDYESRHTKGEMTLEEAQSRAYERIKNLRYEGQEYFWINDMGPKMIMHPFKPELDGKDLNDFKDPNGKALFVEFVRTCREKGEGFVEYLWPKPGESQPVPKISYVKLMKPMGWVIGSGIYIDDVQKEISGIRYQFAAIIGFFGSLGMFACFLMARSISRPIHGVSEGISSIAEEVARASDHIASASHQLADGASQQAAGIEEISSSLEEMSSMTRQNADNSGEANRLLREVSKTADETSSSLEKLTHAMEGISKASEETQKIVKGIDEIAFQTNLLALNAAVEAARAGQAGTGFAVVADEVRSLALRAAEAARNTAELIDGTSKKIGEGSRVLEKTNAGFTQMAAGMTKSVELVGEIAVASREQALGIEQISKAMSDMDQVVQQNAASAEETSSVSEELKSHTLQMKGFTEELAGLIDGSNSHESTVSGFEMEAADQSVRIVSSKSSSATKALARI